MIVRARRLSGLLGQSPRQRAQGGAPGDLTGLRLAEGACGRGQAAQPAGEVLPRRLEVPCRRRTTASGHDGLQQGFEGVGRDLDRKSTRLNSSHVRISYAVFCLKKKKVNLLPVVFYKKKKKKKERYR